MQSEEIIRVLGDNQEDIIRWYFGPYYFLFKQV